MSAAWRDQALDHLKDYVKGRVLHGRTEPFRASDVRDYAESRGLPLASNNHVWGGVMVKARNLGVITNAGFGMSTYDTSNPKPISLWLPA